MKKRGLSLDGAMRRRSSLIVAVAISVMALAGPAGAWDGQRASVDVAPTWTQVSTSTSYTTLGRSWS
jgi:hypothetical protein